MEKNPHGEWLCLRLETQVFAGVKRGGRWEVLGVPLFCSRSTKANGMGTRVDLRVNFSVAPLSPACPP